jgi:Tol biopolymer transport system component
MGDMSADGRYVVFSSDATNLVGGDTNGFEDIFIRDRTLGTTTRVSVRSDSTQGNGDSYAPFVSSDGRYVVFASEATNLVSGDTNGATDIFVRDMDTGSITRASVDSSEVQGNHASFYPGLSSTGRYVVFESGATNRVERHQRSRRRLCPRYAERDDPAGQRKRH